MFYLFMNRNFVTGINVYLLFNSESFVSKKKDFVFVVQDINVPLIFNIMYVGLFSY